MPSKSRWYPWSLGVALLAMVASCSGGSTRSRDDAALPDACVDAIRDGRTPDAAPDARPDARPDAAPDAPPDAPPDATPDAPPDATPDAPPDAPPLEYVTVKLNFQPADPQLGAVIVTLAELLGFRDMSLFSCTATCEHRYVKGTSLQVTANQVLGLPVSITPWPDLTDLQQDVTINIGIIPNPTSIHRWSDTTPCRVAAALNSGDMLCANDTLTKRTATGEIAWSRNEPNIWALVVADDDSFFTSDGRKWNADGTVQWTVPFAAYQQSDMAIGPSDHVAVINTAGQLKIFDPNGLELATLSPDPDCKYLAVSAASNGDWVVFEERNDNWTAFADDWRFRRFSIDGTYADQTFLSWWRQGDGYPTSVFFAVVADTAIWLINNYNEYWTAYQTADAHLQSIYRNSGNFCESFGVGRNPANQPVALLNDCVRYGAGLRTSDNAIWLYGSDYDGDAFEEVVGVFPNVATLSPNGQFVALSGTFVNWIDGPYQYGKHETPMTAVLKYPTP